MRDLRVRIALVLFAGLAMLGAEVGAQSQPDGQLTIAFDASIAPSFLDPAETPGIATPFAFLYARHDALIKPLPGNNMAPCLAESWRESPEGLAYDFKLREGLTFHNGDAFTAALNDAQYQVEFARIDPDAPAASKAELEKLIRVLTKVSPETLDYIQAELKRQGLGSSN